MLRWYKDKVYDQFVMVNIPTFLSECADNTYGPQCSERCGQCRDKEQCNFVDGSCQNGCEKGKQGAKCERGESWTDMCIFFYFFFFLAVVIGNLKWKYFHTKNRGWNRHKYNNNKGVHIILLFLFLQNIFLCNQYLYRWMSFYSLMFG